MNRMVDLFSGLGGASEAMMKDDDWEVLRIEANEDLLFDVPNTWFCDVVELWRENKWRAVEGGMDILWSSPPCTDFSRAYNAPGPTAEREGIEFRPDMSLLEATLVLMHLWKPKHYVIENVIGSIPYFQPQLGEPTQIIGPYVLWHNLPTIVMPDDWQPHSKKAMWGGHPLSANRRAKIPLELSEAVIEAYHCPTMEDFS